MTSSIRKIHKSKADCELNCNTLPCWLIKRVPSEKSLKETGGNSQCEDSRHLEIFFISWLFHSLNTNFSVFKIFCSAVVEQLPRIQKSLYSFWTNCCSHNTFSRWALPFMHWCYVATSYLIPYISNQTSISHSLQFVTFLHQEGFFSSEAFLYKFLSVWDGSLLRPQILDLLSNVPVVPSTREFSFRSPPFSSFPPYSDCSLCVSLFLP